MAYVYPGMNFLERMLVKKELEKGVKALSKYTTLTHFLAGLIGVLAAFLMSPAGQALQAQYPHLVPAVQIIFMLAALYKNPKTSNPPDLGSNSGTGGGTTTLGKFAIAFVLLALYPSILHAQSTTATPPAVTTPTPTQTSVNLNIGASALGLMSSQSTPATDVTLKLAFTKNVSLRSDNVLAPSTLQYYGGGIEVALPNSFLSKTVLAPLSFYTDASVGVDRILTNPAASPSHIAFMAGGGFRWNPTGGLMINLVEFNVLHAPGAPWGNNAPVVAGGISYLWGKQ